MFYNLGARAPGKYVIENYFSYFSAKTYVVGTQKNSRWVISIEHPKHVKNDV